MSIVVGDVELSRRGVKKFLDNFMFPGVIIHEVAHYLIISFMVSTDVKDVKISRYDDSYISYQMRNPRVYKTFLISFAPFYLNTGISIVCFYYLLQMDLLSTWYNPVIFLFLYYLAIVTASKSLPSTKDMTGVFDEMKRQFFTTRFIILIFLGPIYLLLTVPMYLVSVIRMKSSSAYYSMGVGYALIVLIVSIASSITGYTQTPF